MRFKEYYLKEIISKEKWVKDYKKIFMKNFDSKKYQKIVKQLTNLFKKLNRGKLNKTVIFDFKGKKPDKLNKDDMTLINLLLDLGYSVNKNMYQTGVAIKDSGKKVKIFDILQSYRAKRVDKMKDVYDKTKNKNIKKQIDFIDNLDKLNILKNGKLNLRNLSIYDNKNQKIVFTYDHRAIASQSTSVGWTSCMNLDKSSDYKQNVGSGASDGVFIAYLALPGDEYTLDHPKGRVLFKPYEGITTGKLYWKADKIYPEEVPDVFKNQAQKIINSVQGNVPGENDIYNLTSNTYVDELEQTINTADQQTLNKIALNKDIDDGVRKDAIEKIEDQEVLSKIALNDENRYVRSKAIEKITDQKTLKKIVLNKDEDWRIRLNAVKKITDQKTLKKIALNDEDWRIRLNAVKKITDQKTLNKIALNDETFDVRKESIKKITDQEVLKKIVLNKDEKFDLKLNAIEKITDQEILKQIALNDENPNSKYSAEVKLKKLGYEL